MFLWAEAGLGTDQAAHRNHGQARRTTAPTGEHLYMSTLPRGWRLNPTLLTLWLYEWAIAVH
jgi:hypothetical protein